MATTHAPNLVIVSLEQSNPADHQQQQQGSILSLVRFVLGPVLNPGPAVILALSPAIQGRVTSALWTALLLVIAAKQHCISHAMSTRLSLLLLPTAAASSGKEVICCPNCAVASPAISSYRSVHIPVEQYVTAAHVLIQSLAAKK